MTQAAARGAASGLALGGVAKAFGAQQALRPLELELEPGRFVALLGPSGCGKTTLLRLIAGLERPDQGWIRIGGEDVTALPPERRHVGLVFQHYALLPQLSVFENVAFGLRARRDTADLRRRVFEALEMVELGPLAERGASELSGGEQQRVALARAVVGRPRLLLFDEPLSNLDARLRVDTRLAIHALVRRLGVTAIYVTHDQEEALSIADELLVMRAGAVLQRGAPETVYAEPATPWVAAFLGRANLLPLTRRGAALCLADEVELALPGEGSLALIRPEQLWIPAADEPAWGEGEVVAREFLGQALRLQLQSRGGSRWELLLGPRERGGRLGERLRFVGDPQRLRLFADDDR